MFDAAPCPRGWWSTSPPGKVSRPGARAAWPGFPA